MYDVSYFEARGRHKPLGLYGGGEVDLKRPFSGRKRTKSLRQVLGDRGPAGPSHHQGQRNHPGERYPGSTQAPPESSTYKKPELKSLGTPNQPTSPSTAIQLEVILWTYGFHSYTHSQAGDPSELRHDGRHTHWKLARWIELPAWVWAPVSAGGLED